MKVLKLILEWITNPITKSLQVSNSDKLIKVNSKFKALVFFVSALVTAIIVLFVYFVN